MEQKQIIDNRNDEISSLRKQLGTLQDQWSEQEQRAEAAEKKVAILEQQVSTFSEIIKSSRKELKAQKKDQQKSERSNKLKLREAINANLDLEQTAEKHAREADSLKKQCQDLQRALDKALAASVENSSFNSEGFYKKLYTETLTELDNQQEQHRQDAYSFKTKLQNAEEAISSLTAEVELGKTKIDILTSTYEQALSEEKRQRELLEEQVKQQRDGARVSFGK